jgi:hypothetical protein
VLASFRRFRRTCLPVVVSDARVHLVLQQVFDGSGVPQLLAAFGEHSSPTQKSPAWIAASYQSNDEQYQDRPNCSGDDLIDDPCPDVDTQARE